jgi:hypothetical protein
MAGTILLVALVTIAQPVGNDGKAWRSYTAQKGGFSIKLPGPPEEEDRKLDAAKGGLSLHVLQVSGPDIAYSVYYYDLKAPLPANARARYLEELAHNVVRTWGGKVSTQKAIKYGRHPGRDLAFEHKPAGAPGVQSTRLRIYLVGERLYQIQAAAPRGSPNLRDVDAFLDSFSLLAEPRPGPEMMAPDGWQTFLSGDGGFTVAVPREPRESKQDVAGEGGSLKTVRYQVNAGPVVYIITYVDYPAATVKEPKAVLDLTRDLAVESSKGKLLSEKRILLGRNPGREVQAEIPIEQPRDPEDDPAKAAPEPIPGRLTCRIYLVRRRVYQVMAIYPRDDAPKDEIERFFKSFKLIVKL